MNRESSLNYLKSNISFICVLICAVLTAIFLSSVVINCAKKYFVHPVSAKSYIKNDVQNQNSESELSQSDKYMENISDIMRYSLAKDNMQEVNKNTVVDESNDKKEDVKDINISDISLVAIMFGETYSLAVFKTNSEDVIISEGEKIGNFTLKEIFKDKVILVNSKGKEFSKLLLFGAELEPEEKEDTTAGNTNKTEVSISKREFLSLFEPPEKLMKDLILSPYSKDNRPYGIRITTINPESLMSSKIGLKQGDVLLKINNRILSSPEEAMAAYSTIKNEREIVFNIDRNGKIFDLKVSLI